MVLTYTLSYAIYQDYLYTFICYLPGLSIPSHDIPDTSILFASK